MPTNGERLTNSLHDNIDRQEQFRERAATIVRDTFRKELPIAMRAVDPNSPDALMNAIRVIVARVAEELTDETSSAVQRGYQDTLKRRAGE